MKKEADLLRNAKGHCLVCSLPACPQPPWGRGDNSKRINIMETENKFSGLTYVFVFTLCQMPVWSNGGKKIGGMGVGGGHKEPGISQQLFLPEIRVLDLVNVA